ncbi:MAG: flagellar hook-basal body protein [Clostridiales bacterium]|jgi:flagellar basal-body rod protein FlgG|nr:flagellar hook-basal body protein [Clostridiales bacterium]
MFRGLYIAATGMMLQRRKMETITNNITNSDTNGYKKDYLISHTFDDVMILRINDSNVVDQRRLVGPLNFGTQVDMISTDFTIGNFEDSGSSTDLLIAGEGFFVMETPQGERYTRAGAFLINSEGYLIDGSGNFLMGTNGRVYVGNENFTVLNNGDVVIGNELVNTVRVVSFADNGTLRKEGNNLYSSLETPVEEVRGMVKQGFLENSNVDIAREMVDMMTVYRAYETNQKMISMIDEINGKAVNEIGRVR